MNAYSYLVGKTYEDGDATGLIMQTSEDYIYVRFKAEEFVSRHSRDYDNKIEQENWID